MISLNLLPPEQKRRIQVRIQLSRWRSAGMIVLVISLFSNLAAGVGDWWLSRHHQLINVDLQKIQSDTDRSSTGLITQQIRQLNNTVTPLNLTLPQSRSWSNDIVVFLNALPTTITLNELSISVLGDLELSGVAATRSEFLVLDTKLKLIPSLTNVKTDSQASKPEDVPFHYTAKMIPPTP